MEILVTTLVALGLAGLAWECRVFAQAITRTIATLRNDHEYKLSCLEDRLDLLANPHDAINAWDRRIQDREKAFFAQIAKLEAEIHSLKASPEYRSRQAERDAISTLRARS